VPQYSGDVTILLAVDGGQMVARCLEHDIAAFGRTVEEAMTAWRDVFAAQILLDLKAGRAPLEGIEPAPPECFEMYERGRKLDYEPILVATGGRHAVLKPELRVA
jgi:hypothetical protein